MDEEKTTNSEQAAKDVRQLIDELKTGIEQFSKQQDTFVSTYSKVITSLNKNQETYAESLKVYLGKLKSDMKPIPDINSQIEDLVNASALLVGVIKPTTEEIQSLGQLTITIKNELTTWSTSTKKEIKRVHQEAGKNIFRRMKLFILLNTAGTLGTFALIFYFFYQTGIFHTINP
jgi:DNA repair exonuclease SbcCD ATPase subunit